MLRSTPLVVCTAALAGTASAQVTFTDWVNFGDATVQGNVAGTTVTFVGGFIFANTQEEDPDFWTAYPGTYTSPAVPNLPGRPDLIGLDSIGGTLNFGSPVTNPVMNIVSLGQGAIGTRWHFDAPFVILSQGEGGWGNGPLTNPSGNILQGNEGHGTIQFIGTFQQITWSITDGESWAGFTVGVPIPAPSAAATLGLAGLALARRRRSEGASPVPPVTLL